MTWTQTTLYWYLMLLIVGAVFFPLTRKIFNKFSFDSGYPFAKTLGIILLSYSVYVLGTIKILPFSRFDLIFVLCLFAIINFFIFKKNKSKLKAFNFRSLIPILFEEIIFKSYKQKGR